MKINDIQLTPEEMRQAVSEWLARRGVAVTVRSVDSEGYPIRAYSVECSTDPEPDQPKPMPEILPITTQLAPAPQPAEKAAT